MASAQRGFDLKVLQFNVLAKSAASTHYFPYAVSKSKSPADQLGNADSIAKLGTTPEEFFDQPGEEGTWGTEVLSGARGEDGKDSRKIVLSWSERLPVLLEQMQRHSPDVVFLEEVDADTVSDFVGGMPGYGSAYHAPGCLLLWREELLGADGSPQLLTYQDGKKSAVLRPLRVTSTGACLVAAVTHLHWDPSAPLQAAEARELLEHLQAHAALPVLLGGDFNSGPTNAVMAEVLKAPPRSDAPLKLVDLEDLAAAAEARAPQAFTAHVPRAPSPKLTDARRLGDPANPVKVDYVFAHVPEGLSLRAAALDCGGGFVPSAGNGLPSLALRQGSDHIPVAYRVHVE